MVAMPDARSGCPDGFECDVNSTTSTMRVRPGYWRLSSSSATAYRCSGDENGPCVGGREAGFEGGGYCAGNISWGPLCEVCGEAHYFDSSVHGCTACPESGSRTGLLLFLVAGVLLLLGGLSQVLHTPPQWLQPAAIHIDRIIKRGGDMHLKGTLKVGRLPTAHHTPTGPFQLR